MPADPYRLEVTIPGLPKLPNQLLWKHWRTVKRNTDAWKGHVRLATLGQRPPAPLKCAYVVCRRYGVRACDPDALPGSFKPLLDGLVEARILAGDRAENFAMGAPGYRFHRVAHRADQRITIEVVEIEHSPVAGPNCHNGDAA